MGTQSRAQRSRSSAQSGRPSSHQAGGPVCVCEKGGQRTCLERGQEGPVATRQAVLCVHARVCMCVCVCKGEEGGGGHAMTVVRKASHQVVIVISHQVTVIRLRRCLFKSARRAQVMEGGETGAKASVQIPLPHICSGKARRQAELRIRPSCSQALLVRIATHASICPVSRHLEVHTPPRHMGMDGRYKSTLTSHIGIIRDSYGGSWRWLQHCHAHIPVVPAQWLQPPSRSQTRSAQ